jgi:hypothetical protein
MLLVMKVVNQVSNQMRLVILLIKVSLSYIFTMRVDLFLQIYMVVLQLKFVTLFNIIRISGHNCSACLMH